MPLVPPYIESLHPYEAGRTIESVRQRYGLTHIAKLASNENPLGPSPKAIEAIARTLSGLNLYPDGGLELRTVLAREFDVKVENVIAGSGSEGIISNIIRTFLCDEDEVLTTDAAFIGFQVIAKSRGVKYRTVPYSNWHYDLEALAHAINPNTKIIFLANPNNPTGTIFTRRQFDEFYKHVPERVLIILDEAYFEYARDNPHYPDSMHYRYDNVITLRTFSKIYGLAGVRIGYGFAHEELIGNLLKVKLPFEPSTPALAAGIAALGDKEFLHRSLEVNARGLKHLTEGLEDMGLTVVPSHANFLMTVLPTEADALRIFEELLAQGVIVRPLKAFGLPNCLRISTGLDEDNRLCIEALRKTHAASLEQPTSVEKDFLPLNGTDYVEFYVGNARQAAHFYRSAFGFQLTAYRGPETGHRESASYVLTQNKIRFVFTTPLAPESAIADHVRLHGDGVRDIALWVDDAESAWRETTQRGGKSVREPETLRDAHGEARIASIATYGDTIHTFVERNRYNGAFLPGFVAVETDDVVSRPAGLKYVDHMVGNVGWGEMNRWVEFYSKVMGFRMFKHFDDKDISTEYSALMSKVMSNGNERVKFPINEPAEGKRKSQIEEYLQFYRGPGVQHIAMATDHIIETVGKLQRQGVEFLRVPNTYYDDLLARVGPIDEDLAELRQLGILVDRDDEGYMLQIFTRPVEDRPTLFYEVIQRKGSRSFGKGNFKALFEAIEREQERRGNL